MAQQSSKNVFSTDAAQNVGIASSATHQIVASVENTNAIVASISTNQINTATFNQLIKSFKPFAKALITAAGKVGNQAVSEIAGPVWKEFEALTPFQKLLLVLGTAIVVGATAYFSWKLIRGNWDTIKGFLDDQMKKASDVAQKTSAVIEGNLYVKRILDMFAKKMEAATISQTDVQQIIQQFIECGGKGFIAAFMEHLAANQ